MDKSGQKKPCRALILCIECPAYTDSTNRDIPVQPTVGPLIIESLWRTKHVSTGALEDLNDLLVVQTNFWKE